MKYFAVCFLCIFFFLFHLPYTMAEQPHAAPAVLDPIVITGSRIPERLSKSTHTIHVIEYEEIKNYPVDNIPDLLEYVNGVDVRQRGAHGVQADISIRGGAFEQTLILVDGVSVTDSQTGHHNLDIPLNLSDIERIEVLKGPGARVYGPNAMAGVVNIITRTASETDLQVYTRYGDYGFYDLGAGAGIRKGPVTSHISASYRSSEGHIDDEPTDFDIRTVSYTGNLNAGAHQVRMVLGYTEKDFGAYRFYTDVYPDQEERTETLLAYTTAQIKLSHLEIHPKIYIRSHQDNFRIRINETWFTNEHKTDTYGLQLSSLLETRFGLGSLGAEIHAEDIESSNLGDHDRHRVGLFFEHRFSPTEKINLTLGASAVYYSEWDWEYWPGASLNIELADGLHCFGSVDRSYRVPSYTELFYFTPANQGNPQLDPESAWACEAGIRWKKKIVHSRFSFFVRDAQDVIDWTRPTPDDPWKVRNVTENKTVGMELGVDLYPNAHFMRVALSKLSASYTYLDSDWNPRALESKYILDHLRHQVHLSLFMDWLPDLTQVFKARFGERMNHETHLVVDTRLVYVRQNWEIYLDVTNLFDEDDVEAGFAPVAGRWIIAGLKWHLRADINR